MIKVMMGSDRRKKGPLKKSGFPLKRGQLQVLDLKFFIQDWLWPVLLNSKRGVLQNSYVESNYQFFTFI